MRKVVANLRWGASGGTPEPSVETLKGNTMDIRKIAVVGGLAVGAALAFAPLASATPVDPTLVTDTLDSEISSENSLFEFEALLAGDSADVTKGGAGVFDTIPLADVPKITDPADASQLTTLEYELYGVNPIAAGISGDSGPFSEFNGALTEFDNAYNVEVYSLLDGGVLDTNVGDYIENSSLNTALGLTSTTDAFDYLWNFGVGDLSAFSGVDLSFLDIAASV